MKREILIVALAATVVAGTALGNLDRIAYVSGSGWNTELVHAGNFLDVVEDTPGGASGTLYLSKAGGGMARSWESGGSWVNDSTLSGMGSGIYSSIDGIHHVANDTVLMDSSGLSRGYYSGGWQNDAIASGSFSKISHGSGYMGYAINSTGTGAIRYWNSSSTWYSDAMGGVSANTYTAVFGDRNAANNALLGGANGLERTYYASGWKNDVLSTTPVIAFGQDSNEDITYIAKAGGGLMRYNNVSDTLLDDMAAAGTGVYVDIVGYGQSHSLFMLTEDGDIERAYYSGGWNNEVIATGDYTALAQGNENHEVFAIPEPATLGIVVFVGGGLLWIRRMFMV